METGQDDLVTLTVVTALSLVTLHMFHYFTKSEVRESFHSEVDT